MEVACESLATVQPCASSPGLASRCALKAEFSLAPSHDLHLSRLVSNSCQSVSCAQVNSPKSEKDRGTLDTLPTRHGGPAFPSRGSREPCREPARGARDRSPPGRADAGRGRQAAPASSARPAHGPHTSHVTATGSLNYRTPSTSPATAVTHPIQHFPKELEA